MMAHGGLDYTMNKHITKFSLKTVKTITPIEIDVSALTSSAQQATEAMHSMASVLAQTRMSMEVTDTVMQTYNTLLEADTQELINQLMRRWASL
jgi:hypothetical protein